MNHSTLSFIAISNGVNVKFFIPDTIFELSEGLLNCPSGLVVSKITLPLKLNHSIRMSTTSRIVISSDVLKIIGDGSS